VNNAESLLGALHNRTGGDVDAPKDNDSNPTYDELAGDGTFPGNDIGERQLDEDEAMREIDDQIAALDQGDVGMDAEEMDFGGDGDEMDDSGPLGPIPAVSIIIIIL